MRVLHPSMERAIRMVATGTDIKPLEVVMFMRTVKSRNGIISSMVVTTMAPASSTCVRMVA